MSPETTICTFTVPNPRQTQQPGFVYQAAYDARVVLFGRQDLPQYAFPLAIVAASVARKWHESGCTDVPEGKVAWLAASIVEILTLDVPTQELLWQARLKSRTVRKARK